MSNALALPRELTIYTVGELLPLWLDWLHTSGNDTVDAATVTEADAAGVQMLVALQRALHEAGRKPQLLNPSPALIAACTGLGLQDMLGATA